ncbi:MAG: Mannitol dehydrogenase domain protein [Solirubrobacterales bacterium]|nr:Mannitol dehydrogenase domain protein [Solirubrobacterales bacterium]
MLAASQSGRPSAGVRFPTYERSALRPGIVHIGVGSFHRAHQGVFLDELAERGLTDWGVVGVGLRSATGRDALLGQGCDYAVLQRSAARDEVRVVGILLDYLFGAEDPAAVLAALTRPATKVVTLTVTGDGYGVDSAGELDLADPQLRHDLARPREPRSVLGYLVESLRLRMDASVAPFTVLSCDNIPSNGATARRAVVSFARLRDEKLADWIEQNVSFPASVVDRITPETTAEHRRLLESQFGIACQAAVVSEDYSQWIIEDEFCNHRPPLEEVGVRFVADVTPYELNKKRLLNGTHCALGYLGYLCGYEQIDEALCSPVLARYAKSLMDDEVGPLLPRMLGVDLDGYKRSLLTRFANPRIGDPLQRLCGRGSTKMPAYLLPSLTEAIDQGRPHEKLTMAVAAWFRYLRGVDFEGNRIEVKDELKATLQPLARQAGDDPRPLLSVRSVFGELGDDEQFVGRLEKALCSLERRGPAAAIEACLADRLSLAA